MSSLEVEARRLLTPMIMGQPATLVSSEMATIALWATKTHQMYRFGIVRRPPLEDELRQVFIQRQPPRGTLTFLAAWNGAPGAAYLDIRAHLQQLTRIGEGPVWDEGLRAELLTVRIGYLVVQTEIVFPIVGGVPVRLNPRDREWTREHVLDIWPLGSASTIWPPPAALDDAGFERLCHRMTTG